MGLTDYLADHYGTCARGPDCYHGQDGKGPGCLKNGWRGRACEYWQPVKARSWEELRALQGLSPSPTRGAE